MTTSLTLQEWLTRSTLEQRRQLFRAANTSQMSVYQMATGRRSISPAKAAEIEQATLFIHATDPNLPPVLRTSTNQVCAKCPHALTCKGGDK